MKFTANQIMNIYTVLNKFATKDLTLKNAIAIADNLEALTVSNKIINEKRTACVQEYGKKDENGELVRDEQNPDSVIIDNVDEFNKKIIELLNTEIEVDIKKFSLDNEKDIVLSPVDILNLRPILKGDTVEVIKKEDTVIE